MLFSYSEPYCAGGLLDHCIQTTQIYAEISQRTADRELKAWNDRWFLKKEEPSAKNSENSMIPDFLT